MTARRLIIGLALTSCHACEEPSDAKLYPVVGTGSRTEVVVECGSGEPLATFVEGWGRPNGRSRPNLSPRARVNFFFHPAPVAHALVLEANNSGRSPQIVTVRLNGRAIGSAPLKAGSDLLMLQVRQETLVDGTNSLEIESAAPLQFERFSVRPLQERAWFDAAEGRRGMFLGAGWTRAEPGKPSHAAAEATFRAVVATKPGPYEVVLDATAAARDLEIDVMRGSEVIGTAPFQERVVTRVPLAEGSITDGDNVLRLRSRQVGTRERRAANLEIWRLELRPRGAQ